MPSLLLASSSPRRREMLALFPFVTEIALPRADEALVPGEDPATGAERIALLKARSVIALRGAVQPVLAADTVVVVDGAALGKPRDAADARRMLRLLAGRTHQVVTGVAVLWKEKEKAFSVSSDVVFKPLTDTEITDYIASGEPMDKAGAYAVQGLGGFMVSAVRGSVSNVVGLPLAEVVVVLQEIGFLDGVMPRQ